MPSSSYDVLIIGGGQAGVPLAHALAAEGRRVALAERKHLGGTCVNYGCTPTKAVVASARVAHQARRAGDFGLRVSSVEVDFPAVLDRARGILLDSRTGLQDGFAETDNPALLRGHARFEGAGDEGFRLRVGEQDVTAERVVLNVGGRTRLPPIEGLGGVDAIHAGNWLEHTTLPERLVVIGGGYIGLEMGQVYRRLGSQVTIVQHGDQLVPHEDADVAEALQRVLEGEGITVHLQTEAKRVEQRGDGLVVSVEAEDGAEARIEASHLFLATGRQPNTDDLGLDTVGVELDDKGYVQVDERLATTAEGIWATGDVRGGPMFTHTSWDDHRIVLAYLTGDGERTTDRIVPYGIFTDPELGRVGLTEKEARERGRHVKVACYDMASSGKAAEIGETDGFIKVVVDAETDEILGAAVLAAEGAEIVHAYIDIMNAGAPYTVIQNAIHIHPTLSEAVQSVFKRLES